MSDATTPRLKVSREGVVLIKSFEGFRPRAVRAEDGGWVIGYGHRAAAREGLAVSEPEAELLLQYDLLPVVKALNDRISGRLNQHQFDALASFAISIGVDRFLASDVLSRVNEGQAGAAAPTTEPLVCPPESAEHPVIHDPAELALSEVIPGAVGAVGDPAVGPCRLGHPPEHNPAGRPGRSR